MNTDTHLLKLARFCITLAMSVSVRDVRSAGYSCIKLNREGDMMAGHMKRRNREELMRLSARSSLPRSAHLALHEAKTSFSSRGNMLKQEHDFISHCQGEQQDKMLQLMRNPWEFKVRRLKTYRKEQFSLLKTMYLFRVYFNNSVSFPQFKKCLISFLTDFYLILQLSRKLRI